MTKILLESTARKTARGNKWCSFRASRRVNSSVVHIFTDGSSTGWYGAVVLIDGVKVRRASAWEEAGPMRNVAAELRALVLGLQFAPRGRECVVVFDYLGVGAWMVGAWNMKNPGVREIIGRAREVIRTRQLTCSYVHHGGHQTDDSDYTYWNGVADALCNPDRERLGEPGFYDDE